MNALIEGMREVRASFGEALSSVDSTEALGELRVRNLGKKGAGKSRLYNVKTYER